jgi:hypothetical protein
MALQPTGLMSQLNGAKPSEPYLDVMRKVLTSNAAPQSVEQRLANLTDGQRQFILSQAQRALYLLNSKEDGDTWEDLIDEYYRSGSSNHNRLIAEVLQQTHPIDPPMEGHVSRRVKAEIASDAARDREMAKWDLPPIETIIGKYAQPNAATLPNTGPFVDRLKQSESSGKLSAEYQTKDGQTYSGLYQFGASRLADYKAASGDRFTQDEFKQDAALQEKIMAWHLSDIDQAIAGLGDKAQGYNKDGLRAVAHLGGKSGMVKYVKSGGTYDPSDELGTSLSDYYAKFSAKADQQA